MLILVTLYTGEPEQPGSALTASAAALDRQALLCRALPCARPPRTPRCAPHHRPSHPRAAANTAANLTAIRIQTAVKSLADLPGKAVGTAEGYQDDLAKRNIQALVFPWDNVEDEEAMWNALRVRHAMPAAP